MTGDKHGSMEGTLQHSVAANPDNRKDESPAHAPFFNIRAVLLFVLISVAGLVIVDLWPMLTIESRRREFLEITQKGKPQNQVREELEKRGFSHNGGPGVVEYNIHTREPICIRMAVKVASLYDPYYGTRVWLTACDLGAVIIAHGGKVDHGSLASKWTR